MLVFVFVVLPIHDQVCFFVPAGRTSSRLKATSTEIARPERKQFKFVTYFYNGQSKHYACDHLFLPNIQMHVYECEQG